MIYSIEDIRRIVEPIARRHGAERVWLFGSYARGEARADSDIDLLVESGKIKCLFKFTDFYLDLAEAFNLELDIVTKKYLWEEFAEQVEKEEILIYG
ncbi:MAG: nucleotidyltransferase domain-containing protein [Deltaproteobacteria bacterium]|jgi:predicted nucleotidyltransferase|nr:nucleotidyltransferase domain-containing protein [Deltaproteobacteria bacterium]